MQRFFIIGLLGVVLVVAGVIWGWLQCSQDPPSAAAPASAAAPRVAAAPAPRSLEAPSIAAPNRPSFDVVRINPPGDAVMAGTNPGADGLTMLPFFNGERTPDLPNARGSLFGMDMGNLTRGNLYRAAMEGATYALRNGFDALQAAGMQFDSIRLTGGGSHSAAWRQMVADVFDLPVQVPEQAEGAAFGAALQALWAHGRASGTDIDCPEASFWARVGAALPSASPRQTPASARAQARMRGRPAGAWSGSRRG